MSAVDADLGALVWGVRLVLVVSLVAVLGLLWSIWRSAVRPVLLELRRSRHAGDWWAPWVPREDGSWGPLTDNRWWAEFRARERGERSALAVRWGVWGGVALVLGVGCVAAAAAAVVGVVAVWV
ncbi:hypothetical protein KMZ32_00885 [Phycicoccus sp. MAQZ13P-2]|uniref:hypothetical protein n=1 Tax=Phycicoccus mangrovi TaxID=2840470 RepID=UPI001C005A99|nr:hypothetical protein [Phycicoccus mangrovi]MBT9254246.1 hypothetical protein [Phycicoccus mangrovi]MBT9272624.1 hypothetical protein [Phycicoccus mangrovi]